MKNIKNFIKEHKKEILLIGGTILFIGGCIFITKTGVGKLNKGHIVLTGPDTEINELFSLLEQNKIKEMFIVAEDVNKDIHIVGGGDLMDKFIKDTGPRFMKAAETSVK